MYSKYTKFIVSFRGNKLFLINISIWKHGGFQENNKRSGNGHKIELISYFYGIKLTLWHQEYLLFWTILLL